MSKRSCPPDSDLEYISLKQLKGADAININPVLNSADLDNKVLVIQNKNLYLRCMELQTESSQYEAEIENYKSRNKKLELIVSALRNNLQQYNNDINYVADCKNIHQGGCAEFVPHNYDSTLSFIDKLYETPADSIISWDDLKILYEESFHKFKLLVNLATAAQNNTNCNNTAEHNNGNIDESNSKVDGLNLFLTPAEYTKFRTLVSEYNFLNDQFNCSKDEIHKLSNQVEKLTCDLHNVIHRYNGLISRFKTEVNQHKQPLPENNVQNVKEKNNSNQSENVEMLKSELKSYKELAQSRLVEINDWHMKYLQAVDHSAVSNSFRYSDSNSNSEKYNNSAVAHRYNYDELLNDSLLLKQQVSIYRDALTKCISEKSKQFQQIKESLNTFRDDVKDVIAKLNRDLYNIRVEYYKNEYNYKKQLKIKENIKCGTLDMLESLKVENERLRDEKLEHFRSCVKENADGQLSVNEPILEELENLTKFYEECSTQNVTLLKQIQESENAHLNSFTENLKLRQSYKLIEEERGNLERTVSESDNLMDSQKNEMVKLETKCNDLSENLTRLFSDWQARTNIIDGQKRKFNEIYHKYLETSATIEENKTKMESYSNQIVELKRGMDSEMFRNKRNNEELALYKAKYDTGNKNHRELINEKILQEEIKILKTKLVCSSCNINTKDAITTKCFHVFCFECLLNTYNNRQRKCPRCSQSFGKHDFHKIYF